MSQRDFATSGRPVCKNSLFLKIRPLHHSEKRQLNQISVKSHHCYRNDQRYERIADINARHKRERAESRASTEVSPEVDR